MAARIIGKTGKARGVEHVVADTVRIGSGTDAALRIDNPNVARLHAQIIRVGRQFFVEDLGSRSGTSVNGERITRAPIRHLDVLSIGPDIDLIFLEETPSGIARARAFRAAIVWTKGPFAGRTDELSSPGELEIGRTGPLEEVREISRRHAVLTIDNDRLVIEDINSANGTFVNGIRIGDPTILEDGDEVALANLLGFRVSIASAVPAASGEPADKSLTVRIPDAGSGAGLHDPDRTMDSTPPGLSASYAAPESVVNAASATSLEPRTPARVPPPGVGVHPETEPAPRQPAAAPRESGSAPGAGGPDSRASSANAADPGMTKSDPNFGVPRTRVWSDGETMSATKVAAEGDVPTYLDLHLSPVLVPTPHTIVGVRLEGSETLTLGRGSFLVGRHAEADLHFDSRDVGRRHAKLHVRADGVVVEDLGAANGTFVNDEAVTGECPLPDGSRIKFATVEFKVTLLTSDAQLNG